MKTIVHQFLTSVLQDELIANDFHPLGQEVKKSLAFILSTQKRKTDKKLTSKEF